MNALERELTYPFGESLPAPGATLDAAPSIKWIRMPLPFELNHVNLWLLRDRIDGRDGWTVVDCCISSDVSKAQWEEIFAQHLEGLPILRVIVTHMHPDHVGLAYWICERWQAPLWMSATDFNAARLGSHAITGFGPQAAHFFAAHGLTAPDAVAQIRDRSNYYPSMVPDVPRSYTRLMDGKSLQIGGQSWMAISGFGHAPEHIALHCAQTATLISGDMVLPRISTNVSVYDVEPESNALALFLESIDKFLPLAEDTLVLPSHGKPFKGLHKRIAQLHAHHRARLAEVMQACAERPHTAAEILPVMFKRKLDLHQTTFAMGEAIAHLHLLWHDGQLKRESGPDGIYRFSTP